MTLSAEGLNAVLPEEPLLFVLWHRVNKDAKWCKVVSSPTRAECVRAIKGRGEYWLAEIWDEDLANTLFVDEVASLCDRPA